MTVAQTAEDIAGAAGTIQERAARIIALARTLVDDPPLPPVIVVRRRAILPDDMPGASDLEKLRAACAEAIERQRPVYLGRMFAAESLLLDERHDLIRIIGGGAGTGIAMPDVPSTAMQTWGWQLHLRPAPGKRLRATLGNFELNGNRSRVAPALNTKVDDSYTQHGIVLDGYYNAGEQGQVELEAFGMVTHSHDFSGFVSMSERNRFNLVGLLSYGNGQSGIDITRGGGTVMDSVAQENGGLQFNASNSPDLRLIRCKALRGGRGAGKPAVGNDTNGGGIKISKRPWVGDVSVPCHLHLEDVVIDGCLGVGLSSTSAPPGSRITGSKLEIRNTCAEAINLTKHPGVALEVREIVCADNLCATFADAVGQPVRGGDAAVLVFEGPSIDCGSLTVDGSRAGGINGGWGSDLRADLVAVTGCFGAGVRWQQGLFDAPAIKSEGNGAPDAIASA